MKTFRCEYVEDGVTVSLSLPLAELQRRVGSRDVELDGVPGRFEVGDDENASPRFVIDKGAQ